MTTRSLGEVSYSSTWRSSHPSRGARGVERRIGRVISGRYSFHQGAAYRLKFTNFINREGLVLYPTLQVYPAANAVPRAKQAGALVVIVNAEPTQFDRLADAVLSGPIGEILPALVRPVRS